MEPCRSPLLRTLKRLVTKVTAQFCLKINGKMAVWIISVTLKQEFLLEREAVTVEVFHNFFIEFNEFIELDS